MEIFEISPFSGQNRVNWRGRGPSRFFPKIKIFQLLLLGSPCKNLEPYDKPFCDILEISPFSGQNRVKWGGRRGPRNLFSIGILIFLLLRSPCKFWKSCDNSFLEIEQTARREEREIMPSLMATSLRWRTHSARTKIGNYKLSCCTQLWAGSGGALWVPLGHSSSFSSLIFPPQLHNSTQDSCQICRNILLKDILIFFCHFYFSFHNWTLEAPFL